MVGVHDFVLHILTGNFVTDPSLASRTNLLNLAKMDWDEELLALFGIPRSMLCEMLPPGSVAETLLPSVALATGLPEGLTASDRIVANTGTGSYLLAHSPRPVFDPGMRVFCNASAIKGSYVVEAGMPASGVVYRWFGEKFYGSEAGQAGACADYSLVNTEVEASPRGAKGILFLPHFKGSGAPHFNPGAKGTFHNLDLNSGRGDLGRAILEGIVAEMADNLELLEQLTRKVDWVNSSGGLTRFALFNRIQADMFGRRVKRAEHGEATALGAWIQGAAAVGLYDSVYTAAKAAETGLPTEEYLPDPGAGEFYSKLRAARTGLYDSLYPSAAT